jgi:hypothetical protein
LRRERRGIGQGRRHVAAEHRDRAGEHQPRRLRQGAAGFEHGPGALDVHAHAQIEIGLGGGADDGGEMEHAAGSLVDRALHERVVGDVAGDCAHAPVRRLEGRRLDGVEQQQFVDALGPAVAPRQLAQRQQPLHQLPPDEPGAAGDDDFHAFDSPVGLIP